MIFANHRSVAQIRIAATSEQLIIGRLRHSNLERHRGKPDQTDRSLRRPLCKILNAGWQLPSDRFRTFIQQAGMTN